MEKQEFVFKRKNLKIYDLVNEHGTFLSTELLNQKLECNIKPLQMMSLRSPIPKSWKDKLKTISEPIEYEK